MESLLQGGDSGVESAVVEQFLVDAQARGKRFTLIQIQSLARLVVKSDDTRAKLIDALWLMRVESDSLAVRELADLYKYSNIWRMVLNYGLVRFEGRSQVTRTAELAYVLDLVYRNFCLTDRKLVVERLLDKLSGSVTPEAVIPTSLKGGSLSTVTLKLLLLERIRRHNDEEVEIQPGRVSRSSLVRRQQELLTELTSVNERLLIENSEEESCIVDHR